MKISSLLLFILSGLSAFAQNYNEPPLKVNSLEIIMKAVDAYDNEKYEDALKMLLQVPEHDTAYPLALYETALCYRGMKKPAEAIPLLKKGILLRSEYKRSFYEMLGAAYDEAGEFQNAIKTYYDGLKEFPTYDFFYNEMAIAYSQHKDGDSALANFVKAVQMNPIRALNHLKLSGFLLTNNQLIPAMMAFLVYGIFETNENRLLGQLILYESVLKKELSFSPDSVLKLNFNTEQFEEADQIVKSNMAVSSDYKVPVKITFPHLVKNFYVMLEKIQVNKSENDIWNTFYKPILKKVYDDKKYEPFILQIFSVVQSETVQKEVKKKKKAILEFSSSLIGDIYKKYMKKKSSLVEGTLITAEHAYYGNGNIKTIGNYSESLKMYTGMCYFFNSNGFIDVKGEYDNAGKKKGEWKYYANDGTLSSLETFKAGKLDGLFADFFPNGNMKVKGNYTDGLADGEIYFYRSSGALKKMRTYSKGKAFGPEKMYHDNDLLEQVVNVNKDEKYDGEVKRYHYNGNLDHKANYTNGELNGKYQVFHQNEGTLSEEGEFKEGKRTGKRIKYFEDGKSVQQVEDSYKEGKFSGNYTVYFENGKISEKGTYVNDFIEGDYILNDTNGRMYAKYVYEKGTIKKMIFYNPADGKKKDEIACSGKKYQFKSYYDNGVLFEEGTISNKKREGAWKQYHRNGKLKKEMNYVNDQFSGPYKTYYFHGAPEIEVNYTEGAMDGLYKEYYGLGALRQQGWEVKGVSDGNFYNYEETGIIASDVYVMQGIRQGAIKLFDETGRMNYKQYYDEGILYKVESFDTLGKLINVSENKSGTGKLVWYNLNGKIRTESEYKNGYEHGLERTLFSNGVVSVEYTNKNGMKNGKYNVYDNYGKLVYESNYKLDLLDSTYTLYDFDGNKTSVMRYKYGNLNGKRQWFYPNGKVETEGNYKDDNRHGSFNYYAPDGTLVIQRNYLDGELVSWSYLDASGKMKPATMVDPQKQEVVSYYPNGKKSMEFTLVYGKIHGVYKSWYPNGNIKDDMNWFYGDYEGRMREYFENGTLSLDENYKSENLTGECKYYYETGKLKRTTNYLNGVKHGVETLYDKAGKKTSVIRFYNGEIVK